MPIKAILAWLYYSYYWKWFVFITLQVQLNTLQVKRPPPPTIYVYHFNVFLCVRPIMSNINPYLNPYWKDNICARYRIFFLTHLLSSLPTHASIVLLMKRRKKLCTLQNPHTQHIQAHLLVHIQIYIHFLLEVLAMLSTRFIIFLNIFFFLLQFLYAVSCINSSYGRLFSTAYSIYIGFIWSQNGFTKYHWCTQHTHTHTGQYPYKSSNGYASEPERNYSSDYSIKYKTLDRRRNPSSEKYVTSL